MVPANQEAFTFDAALTGFLLDKYVLGDMAQKGNVFRPVILSRSAKIFILGKIPRPELLILNAPMQAHGPQDAFGSGDTGEYW